MENLYLDKYLVDESYWHCVKQYELRKLSYDELNNLLRTQYQLRLLASNPQHSMYYAK